MKIHYLQPIRGEQSDVSASPDDVFSKKLVGVGFVIYPSDYKVYAPVDGIIKLIFPTKHAIAIQHESGINVLIHVGFSNVDSRGEGFTLHTTLNQTVKKGDLILEFDTEYLKSRTSSLAIPVVFMQKEDMRILSSKIINELFHMEIEVSS